jgi:hypothetical protein
VGGVDGAESMAKHVIEDVVDARAATEFLGRNLERSTFDGGHKVSGELGHEFQDERSLYVSATCPNWLVHRLGYNNVHGAARQGTWRHQRS